jgi:hypothetical protein
VPESKRKETNWVDFALLSPHNAPEAMSLREEEAEVSAH